MRRLVHLCSVCGEHITAGTKTGMCRRHAARRLAKPRKHCTFCGDELELKAKTNRCQRHQHMRFALPAEKHFDYDVLVSRGFKASDAVAHIEAGLPIPLARTAAAQSEYSRGVINRVAFAMNILPKFIVSDVRKRRVVHARAVCAKVMRERGMSLSQIGRRLGRDHSTVFHWLQEWPRYEAENPRITAIAERVAA